MDIGLKSAGVLGDGTFRIGWIDAVFHCLGIADVMAERLKR